MSNSYIKTSSPHIKTDDTTRILMIDMLIALSPALVMGIVYFGFRALTITCVSVISCIVFEYLYRRLLKKSFSIGDLSAVVTGVLLAFCLPSSVPYWIPVVGAFFAIIVVKQLFGGIGKNFVNPALAARAFLFSWPVLMTTWPEPFKNVALLVSDPNDIVTGATPLSIIKFKSGELPDLNFFQYFIGEKGGSLGETSALFLLLGGLYLLYRKVITWHIPVTFIGTVAILTYIFHWNYSPFEFMYVNIFSGGLILGAVFMATDYTTSPITRRGKIIYGIGCGIITVFLRYFGGYPEGVCYAILIMNTFVWLIDKYTRPRQYGTGGGALHV